MVRSASVAAAGGDALWRLSRERLRPYRKLVLAVLALQVLQTIAALLLPSLNARIIDDGIAQGDVDVIWRLGGAMLAISIVHVVSAVAAVFVGALAAIGLGRDVRAALFARVQEFSQQEMSAFGAPSLITRTTNDVQQVQMLVLMTLTVIVMAPVMLVGGVVMALREDAGLSWLLILVVPLLGVLIGGMTMRMVPVFRSMQQRLDRVNAVLREHITGIRVIRAFVREDFESRRYREANGALRDDALAVGMLMALLMPAVMGVVHLASVAVLWFGGHRVDAGQSEVGALVAFLSYLMFVLMAVMLASMMLFFLPRAAVSAERIREVLDSEPTLAPPPEPVRPSALSGRLELREVTFGYPGAEQPVLAGVSLAVAPGQVTAVIGATGSGKSTLIGLVPRLFDATAGQVLLDGHDVRDLDPAAMVGLIGYVPQRAFLFSGTIASNLRMRKPEATDDELWEALRVAQADPFVRSLAGGLEASVSQGGTGFSGGQRQRLCIARALVGQPRLLLLDDCFSALDYATDAALRRELARSARDAAVLMVAQRVATIRDADSIVVLADGHVAAAGTHDELLAGSEAYREIVASQSSLDVSA